MRSRTSTSTSRAAPSPRIRAITTRNSLRWRSSRATPPTSSRATSRRSRRASSSGELARTLALDAVADDGRSGAVPAARAALPVHGGTRIRPRTAGAGRSAPARPGVPPPAAHDRRGARSRALPGRRSTCTGGRLARRELPPRDHVRGRGSRCADGGGRPRARWLGGRLGVGPRGLELRLATHAAASVASALRRVLPARAAIAFHGRIVCVQVERTERFRTARFLPIGIAVEPSPGRGEPESAAERRLHAVVDTLGLHVYSGQTYPDDRFVTLVALTPARSLLGLPADGTPSDERWLEAIHPDDRGRYDEVFCYANERQLHPLELEYRLCGFDGVQRWVWERIFPHRLRDDGVVDIDGVVADVTALHEATNERNELSQRLERVLGGVAEFVVSCELRDGPHDLDRRRPRRRAHARRPAARGRRRADRLVRLRAPGRQARARRLSRAARGARAGRGDLPPARPRRRRALGLVARAAAPRRRSRRLRRRDQRRHRARARPHRPAARTRGGRAPLARRSDDGPLQPPSPARRRAPRACTLAAREHEPCARAARRRPPARAQRAARPCGGRRGAARAGGPALAQRPHLRHDLARRRRALRRARARPARRRGAAPHLRRDRRDADRGAAALGRAARCA